jgi:hypothetical protein
MKAQSRYAEAAGSRAAGFAGYVLPTTLDRAIPMQ